MENIFYIKDYIKERKIYIEDLIEIFGEEREILNIEIIALLEEENNISIDDESILIEIKRNLVEDIEQVFLKLKSKVIDLSHIEKVKERFHNELHLKMEHCKKIDDYIFIECLFDVIEVDLTLDDVGVTLEDLMKMFDDEK